MNERVAGSATPLAQKFFTKMQRNTLSPIFDEEFQFNLDWLLFPSPVRKDDGKKEGVDDSKDEAVGATAAPEESGALRLTVCDFDRFSRRVMLGHVFLRLLDVGISSRATQDIATGEMWRDLMDDMLPCKVKKGELFLTLSYNPDTAILTLGIDKARQLLGSKSDVVAVYVKVTLFDKGKVVKSKKTEARKKTMEPLFEESYDIRIPRHSLSDVHCVVSVCSRNRLGGRQVIGRSMIGSQAHVSGPGLDHWSDCMASPKSTVGQWHILL